MEATTKIYLIRHAEAEGNLYRVAHGQYDSTLTPRGYRQLAALQRRFRDIEVDAVYGSDLFRTRATASAVYRQKNLEFQPLPLLREVNLGDWECRTWAEIHRLDPKMLQDFNKRPQVWHVEGGETFDVVRDRTVEGLRRIARENPGRTVAATTHGAAMRILLGTIQGLSLEEIGETGHADNTAVSLVEVRGDEMKVVFQNDASHLGDDLSTLRRQSWHKGRDSAEPSLWYRVEEEENGRFQEGMLEEAYAGCIQMELTPDALAITRYEIVEDLRGQSFGTQLMGQAVQYARSHGREKVVLTCGEDVAPFFARLGFVETDRSAGLCAMELDIRFVIREIPAI